MLFTLRKKNQMPALAKIIGSDKRFGRLQTRFEGCTRGLGDFARRQKKAYFSDRETELKEIIGLLIQTIAALSSENREHNRSILERSQRLEKIIRLDDSERLNPDLLQEVEELRAFVRDKEARDGEKIEKLSRQVTALGAQLEGVCAESERDGLTGALSRRAFDSLLEGWIAGNRVKPQSFALLILDIDDFKRINATHSHLTGDRALITIADTCRQAVRTGGLLARYGGEEFAILLPEVSFTNAVKKGREICEAIASTGCRLEGISSPEVLTLTVSIGVSVCRKHDTAATLVDRADQALRLAKRAGKNRVMSEKDIDQEPTSRRSVNGLTRKRDPGERPI